MKLAIMQPYLFPYIGYFQLLNVVDKFVIYDDVNYIKQGWVNRNQIINNSKPRLFTLPLVGASSNKLICEIPVNNLLHWNKSFFKTIEQNYKRAPHFHSTFPLIKEVLTSDCTTISQLCVCALQKIMNYLSIDTQIVDTSTIYNNSELKGQNRVLDICFKEHTSHYINPIGGVDLYSKEAFSEKNIKLNFIRSKPIQYRQFNNEFFPWLSIIDVLMFNSLEEIKEMLNEFELV